MSDTYNNIFEHLFSSDYYENDILLDLDLDNKLANSNIPFPSNLMNVEINNPTSSTTNRIHDNNSKDNLLRKIQNHYINFIVLFFNNYLKEKTIIEKNFCKIDYNFKKKVNKKFVEELKTKNLGDILINKISIKYTKYNCDENKHFLEEIENNEIYKKEITELKKLLSINYLDFFRKVYHKSNRYVNLKEFGIDTIIQLSDEVKMFDDLLNQNKRLGEKHVNNIRKCALKNYFSGYLFFCEK